MNLKEMAAELAALTVIKDAVKEATDALREQIKEELINVGADMTKATIDSNDVAKITLITKDVDFIITSENAFVTYVSQHSPDELVQKVRDSFKKVFLESLAIGDDGTIFSTMTGEVITFVQLQEKTPYVSTRFTTGGRESVIQAIHDKRVNSLSWLSGYVQNQIVKEID
jgi:hypothetical protein